MFIIGEYVKIRFKNWGTPCYFPSSGGHKIKNISKIEHTRLFFYILGFIFYGVSRAKADVHNKYMTNFVPGLFFDQEYLLNFIILGVHSKR